MSLRKQAMDHRKHDESMKTLSRKAKARLLLNADLEPLVSAQTSRVGSRAVSNDGSRPGSRHNSRPPSRVGSRAASRAGSRLPSPEPTNRDFDTGDSSSDDQLMESAEEDKLERLITSMKDRTFWKGAYEDRLRVVRGVSNHLCFSPESDDHIVAEVIPIMIKVVIKESGDVARYAARAIAATSMSSVDSADLFAKVNLPLRNLVSNSILTETKEAALHTFGVTAYFGGADVHEVSKAMEFLLEIIKTDGDSVNSLDNADVVCAAMVSWAFLSTFLDPEEQTYYDALEAFEEQLQSSATSVIITAADGVGLLAEAQYGPQERDEFDNPIISGGETFAGDESDNSNDPGISSNFKKEGWTLNYDIFQDRTQPIKNALNELSSSSLKRTKKSDRKEVHSAVRDACHAVDHPWRGPRFSTALSGSLELDSNTAPRVLGHRLLKSGMVLNRWWKLQRYTAITHIVQSGINEYVSYCPKVRAVLRGESMVAPSRFKDVSEDHSDDKDGLVQRAPEWPVSDGEH